MVTGLLITEVNIDTGKITVSKLPLVLFVRMLTLRLPKFKKNNSILSKMWHMNQSSFKI